MKEKGISTLILSEGNKPFYWLANYTDTVPIKVDVKTDRSYKLDRRTLHTINPGDVHRGSVAIIDTDLFEEPEPGHRIYAPYLSFRQLY